MAPPHDQRNEERRADQRGDDADPDLALRWNQPHDDVGGQEEIESAANGLGARLRASDVPAPARLEIARPARMRTSRLALGPATKRRSPTEASAPAIDAIGSANERASTSPSEITDTAPN